MRYLSIAHTTSRAVLAAAGANLVPLRLAIAAHEVPDARGYGRTRRAPAAGRLVGGVDPMKLIVNRDICIGAGMCVLTAPDLFDQDEDDGRVLSLGAAESGEQQAALREAVDVCPSGAIRLVDED